MAAITLERLAAGIKAANAKGDVEAVKRLGAAYRQMQGGATQPLYQVGSPAGMVAPGNLDLNARTVYHAKPRDQAGEDFRTEKSMSIGTDQGEVLIPTVVNGRQLTPEQAVAVYQQTGQNLGTFQTPEAADAYAQNLHQRQATYYAPKDDKAKPPVGLKPGSKEYAQWAVEQAKAGKELPQISQAPEWTPPTAQSTYDDALKGIRAKYFPKATDEQWAEVAKQYAPYDAGNLFKAGLTLGFNDELAGAANAVANLTMGMDPGQGYKDFSELEIARQKLGQEQAGGLGTAAEIGGALLSGRPDMAATRVAGLLPAMWEGVKGGVVGGGVYGAGTAEGGLGDRLMGAANGATLGGVTGAVLPAVVAGARRVITPSTIPAAKARAAQILENEGVQLTAGQTTGNTRLQYREAELGGSRAAGMMDRQAEQFTSAALRRVGVNANRATHDVIDNAFAGIGQQFDDLASRNFIQPDRQLAVDIGQAWRRFEGATNPSTRPRVIERLIRDIYSPNGANRMTGEWYKSTRSELGRLTKSQTPELAEAARDLQYALDDAMARTIQQHNPADAGAWAEVRRLYRNMLVIEDAATRAGEHAADGLISPAALRGAAMRQNKRAFARGQNDFTDLADAGVSTMTPLPNSGTPGRLSAKLFVPAGAASGAAVGNAIAPGIGMIPGAAVGAMLPWAAGRAMLSGPGRAYLTNQLARGPVGGLAALLGAETGRGVQPLLNN